MPDRDGTIKRLQDSLKVINGWCCRTDSLDDPIMNVERAMEDALELLKEQEPRIIAFDELESDNLEVVWFEAKQSTYIEPMLTRGKDFNDSADWFKYGRDWRCWTQRPTDEQREAIPWGE